MIKVNNSICDCIRTSNYQFIFVSIELLCDIVYFSYHTDSVRSLFISLPSSAILGKWNLHKTVKWCIANLNLSKPPAVLSTQCPFSVSSVNSLFALICFSLSFDAVPDSLIRFSFCRFHRYEHVLLLQCNNFKPNAFSRICIHINDNLVAAIEQQKKKRWQLEEEELIKCLCIFIQFVLNSPTPFIRLRWWKSRLHQNIEHMQHCNTATTCTMSSCVPRLSDREYVFINGVQHHMMI